MKSFWRRLWHPRPCEKPTVAAKPVTTGVEWVCDYCGGWFDPDPTPEDRSKYTKSIGVYLQAYGKKRHACVRCLMTALDKLMGKGEGK